MSIEEPARTLHVLGGILLGGRNYFTPTTTSTFYSDDDDRGEVIAFPPLSKELLE